MTKVLSGIILLLGGLIIGSVLWLKSMPKREYKKALNNHSSKYFSLKRYDKAWLNPGETITISKPTEDLAELWKEFQVMDARLPLPTRHPMYISIPTINHSKERIYPELGLSLKSPTGREISKIYLFKHSFFNFGEESQKLFKLPIAKKVIYQLEQSQVWTDLFLKVLSKEPNNYSEMIYNLYLLNLRTLYFPNKMISAKLMEDKKRAVIEIESPNKDYTMEWVLTGESGLITSFLIMTQKDSKEAENLRNKLLYNVIFEPSSPNLTPIIYREFKQLSFKRQVDQEGMLYLFSAWSHDTENPEILREMIYFLERGRNNQEQLKPLYSYAYQKFKKTFSVRDVGIEDIDPQIKLQMQIEWENKENRIKLEQTPANPGKDESEMSPKEKMDNYLERIRQGKQPPKTENKVKFD